MGMKNEIDLALRAHTAWRSKFKNFLNGKASFSIDSIGATDQCDFGRWLDHEGYRMIPASLHDEICAVHQEFHQIAADIVRKIKEKRFAEAKEDISPDGAFNQASNRLRELLLKLSLREPNPAASNLALEKQGQSGKPAVEGTPPGASASVPSLAETPEQAEGSDEPGDA